MIAYKLNHTQRYTDDVNCKNDNGTFQQQMQQIYPSELELTKENQGTSSGSVLEIELSIKNKKFETKKYMTKGMNFLLILSNTHQQIAISMILLYMVSLFLN